MSAARKPARSSSPSTQHSAGSPATRGTKKAQWWSLCLNPSTKESASERPAVSQRVGDEKKVTEPQPLSVLQEQDELVVEKDLGVQPELVVQSEVQELQVRLQEREDALKELQVKLQEGEDARTELQVELQLREDARKELQVELQERENALNELQVKLQEHEDALKDLGAVNDDMVQRSSQTASETDAASALAANALAAATAALVAATNETATAVSGRDNAAAALQAIELHALQTNVEAQHTIVRLNDAWLKRSSDEADATAAAEDETCSVRSDLLQMQDKLTDSKQLALTAITNVEQLKDLLEEAEDRADVTALQAETDRATITNLNLLLSHIRTTAEASAQELVAHSEALVSYRHELRLANERTHRAITERDLAVAQSLQLQKQVVQAFVGGGASAAFDVRKLSFKSAVVEKAAGLQGEMDQVNSSLDELMTQARSAAPEIAAMSLRLLSAEHKSQDQRHLSHRAVITKVLA